MYTSILMLALSGFAPAATTGEGPSWLTDYNTASQQGAKAKKPLAVILGSGANGWQKLSREGQLSSETRKILAGEYVCVHVDTATAEGRQLAMAFEMPGGIGIVISDRTGDLQAFRHEGDLANSVLVSYLQRYADPQRVVRTTDTNPAEEESSFSGSAPSYSGRSYYSTSSSC